MAYDDRRYISGGEYIDEMAGGLDPASAGDPSLSDQMLLAGGYDPMQSEMMSRGQDVQKTAGQGGIYGQKYGPVTGQWQEGETFGGRGPFAGIAGGTGGFGRREQPIGPGLVRMGQQALRMGKSAYDRFAPKGFTASPEVMARHGIDLSQPGWRSAQADSIGFTPEAGRTDHISEMMGRGPEGEMSFGETAGDQFLRRAGGIGAGSSAAMDASVQGFLDAGYGAHEAHRLAAMGAGETAAAGGGGMSGLESGIVGAGVGLGTKFGLEAATGRQNPAIDIMAGGAASLATMNPIPLLAATAVATIPMIGRKFLGMNEFGKGPGYMDYRNMARSSFARDFDEGALTRATSGKGGLGTANFVGGTGARNYWMKDMMDQGYSFEDVKNAAMYYHQDQFYGKSESPLPMEGVPWLDKNAGEGFRTTYGTNWEEKATEHEAGFGLGNTPGAFEEGGFGMGGKWQPAHTTYEGVFKPDYEGQEQAPWLAESKVFGKGLGGQQWGRGSDYVQQWEAAKRAGKNPYEMQALGDQLSADYTTMVQQEEEGYG